ncbi:hypothetical protein H5410_043887 [Solanum commersonii]|uniref:Uncharacterized protein n=1 Tax=Solanum commersonii TaxID=4109 RepID=A0A9J5XZN1_SOLCO|nr:hypothetical protein H5410_043887 [Solanum commersonii]
MFGVILMWQLDLNTGEWMQQTDFTLFSICDKPFHIFHTSFSMGILFFIIMPLYRLKNFPHVLSSSSSASISHGTLGKLLLKLSLVVTECHNLRKVRKLRKIPNLCESSSRQTLIRWRSTLLLLHQPTFSAATGEVPVNTDKQHTVRVIAENMILNFNSAKLHLNHGVKRSRLNEVVVESP